MESRLAQEIRRQALLDRVRNLNLGNNNEDNDNQNEEEITTAMPTVLQIEGHDQYNEYMAKFSQTPIPECDEWEGPVTGHNVKNHFDWSDETLKKLRIISLRELSLYDMAELGEETFDAIHGVCTKKTLANLMLLAYNLRNDSGMRLIPDYEPYLVDQVRSIPPDLIDETRVATGSFKDMTASFDDLEDTEALDEGIKRLAIAYGYLAASYLRLFTKSVENYEKVESHLKMKFNNFFGFEFPFQEFHPDVDVIRGIKKQFELDDMLRNTMYVILHAAASDEAGQNLKEFLFRLHLNYTGLHVYVLFIRCLENLSINCKQLGNMLYSPLFSEQLKALARMLQMDNGKEEKHSREMWKVARLFDKAFFGVLQIKNCLTFALTLAYMVVETSTTRRDGPLKIAGLKDASDEAKGEARLIASKVVYHCRRQILGDKFAGAAVGRLLQKKRNRM
ncbi:TPA_asm: nucleocapsid protein [Leucanthemum virus 1]|uniref:Nucleoprotein n=1 Tax=Leucanthemum virus 1 TaxID=2977970 RepID=A0A9N7AAM7_9RHAB|nr:TPA_asm: nucleocapsid protein [Leucanthemum virus 1]